MLDKQNRGQATEIDLRNLRETMKIAEESRAAGNHPFGALLAGREQPDDGSGSFVRGGADTAERVRLEALERGAIGEQRERGGCADDQPHERKHELRRQGDRPPEKRGHGDSGNPRRG